MRAAAARTQLISSKRRATARMGLRFPLVVMSCGSKAGRRATTTAMNRTARTTRPARRKRLWNRERRGDVSTVDLEHLLLVAIHQVDIELIDTDLGQPPKLGQVAVARADHAEPVGHLVANEARIRRADLGMMEVVVARPIPDIPCQ